MTTNQNNAMSILGRPKLLRQLSAITLKRNQSTPEKSELAEDLTILLVSVETDLESSENPSLSGAAATLRIARYVIDAEELETI